MRRFDSRLTSEKVPKVFKLKLIPLRDSHSIWDFEERGSIESGIPLEKLLFQKPVDPGPGNVNPTDVKNRALFKISFAPLQPSPCLSRIDDSIHDLK